MASSSGVAWVIGAAVVGWLVFGQKKSSPQPTLAPPAQKDPTGGALALPNMPPLAYYTQTVSTTGVPFGANVVSVKPPNGLQPNSNVYQDWIDKYGGTNTYKEYENGTGGLLRQPWEMAYVREHYSPLPAAVRQRWESQKQIFAARYEAEYKKHPPADHFFVAPDQFSKNATLVFRPEHQLPYSAQLAVPVSETYKTKLVDRAFAYRNWGWFLTDEFGRPYEGWGAGNGFDFLQVISTISNAVLPYIPGYGTAANIAIQATIAIAQGKSMKEIALAAARAALPAGAAFAFDLGVGVVLEGKSPKDAVVQAALTELEKKYPGAKAAYESGRKAAEPYLKGTGVQGVPVNTRIIWLPRAA